jgi:hypothetical protein
VYHEFAAGVLPQPLNHEKYLRRRGDAGTILSLLNAIIVRI